MKTSRFVIALCAGLALASVARAQSAPKPGPEHAVLKKLEGTWDATVSFAGTETKGVMTYRSELGGLWMVSEFKGSFFGMPFEGRGLDTFDQVRKKYVSIWADSMTTTPMVSEGTYDPATKKLTFTGEGPGQDGKMTKMKQVSEWKDDDTLVMTMAEVKDGKESGMLTITYKRRK